MASAVCLNGHIGIVIVCNHIVKISRRNICGGSNIAVRNIERKGNIMTKKIILLVLAIFLLTSNHSCIAPTGNAQEMRGVWVATVLNLDYPSMPTHSNEALKNEADAILDRAVEMRLNTIFLQVRPTSDAFYKSEIFPWSEYLTGTQDVMPLADFDPLEYWIRGAHARGLKLHAWINPYRITKNTSREQPKTLEMLSDNHPARLRPELVIAHKGDLYYDPALPEAQDLILAGVKEIIDNYRVDGIHFDDYFYPDRDFADDASYKKYGQGMKIGDWRRNNVNQLIGKVHVLVKTKNQSLQFGISPFGIWANDNSMPQGSKTNGNQAYFSHYADTLKWVREEKIDYIIPQLYWHIGHELADYKTLVAWWSNAVSGTHTRLYIGHAVYRAGGSDSSSPWFEDKEILRQLNLNREYPAVSGSVFFREGNFKDNDLLKNAVKKHYEEYDNKVAAKAYKPVGQESIADNNITTRAIADEKAAEEYRGKNKKRKTVM